ncbi:hypothetical protein D3C84_880360 [compost metagenome]
MLTQLLRTRPPLLGAPHLHADGLNLVDQLINAMGVGGVGGDTQTFELITLGRRNAARPQQQQIRLETEQPLHVDLAVAPDRRHLGQGRGPLATVEHAHQQISGMQFDNDFRQRGGQADHPRSSRQWRGQCQQHQQQNAAHQPS